MEYHYLERTEDGPIRGYSKINHRSLLCPADCWCYCQVRGSHYFRGAGIATATALKLNNLDPIMRRDKQ